MATPLEQYWIGEVARLTARLDKQKQAVADQIVDLGDKKKKQVTASNDVRTQTQNVADARKALAAIPMPADGDPLLVAMEKALVDLANAQASLASADLAVQVANSDLAQKQAKQAALEAELAEAKQAQTREHDAAAERQKSIDRLTTGDLKTLVADATAALANNEATAVARVESEFPTNADAAKSFLARARARRQIIADDLKNADTVAAAAYVADMSALAKASQIHAAAVDALRTAADAGPRLDADRATLVRLAALPAPNPPDTYPILTRWQHDRLHDANKKKAREAALGKVTDIDKAQIALQNAQKDYDTALHDAVKSDPDKTKDELDAGSIKAQFDALTKAESDLDDARKAMTDAEIGEVQKWFAAVPDNLWEQLDKLDIALARLTGLINPAPVAIIAAAANAEQALATELAADRLAKRKQDGADAALRHATSVQSAERETASKRASAYAHSGALF